VADDSPAKNDWREIARKASTEHDPSKLSELVAQLCALLEEQQLKRKALTQAPAPEPPAGPPGEN
jgi:hypothetical protein